MKAARPDDHIRLTELMAALSMATAERARAVAPCVRRVLLTAGYRGLLHRGLEAIAGGQSARAWVPEPRGVSVAPARVL